MTKIDACNHYYLGDGTFNIFENQKPIPKTFWVGSNSFNRVRSDLTALGQPVL